MIAESANECPQSLAPASMQEHVLPTWRCLFTGLKCLNLKKTWQQAECLIIYAFMLISMTTFEQYAVEGAALHNLL